MVNTKKAKAAAEAQTDQQQAPASVNPDDIKAQVAAILAEAKAEAQRIVDEAKAAAEAINTPIKEKAEAEEAAAAARAAREAWLNEEVEIRLFKDRGKYKDDVFVAVNGETVAIKRGEKVRVKRKFALVLDNSERSDYETTELMREKSDPDKWPVTKFS